MSTDASLKTDGAGGNSLILKSAQKQKGSQHAHVRDASGLQNAFSGLLRELRQEVDGGKRTAHTSGETDAGREARSEDRRGVAAEDEEDAAASAETAPVTSGPVTSGPVTSAPTQGAWRHVWAGASDAGLHTKDSPAPHRAGRGHAGRDSAQDAAPAVSADGEIAADDSVQPVVPGCIADPDVAEAAMPDDVLPGKTFARALPGALGGEKPVKASAAVVANERHLPPTTYSQQPIGQTSEAHSDDAMASVDLSAPVPPPETDAQAPGDAPLRQKLAAKLASQPAPAPVDSKAAEVPVPAPGTLPPAQQIATAVLKAFGGTEVVAMPRATSLITVSSDNQEPARLLKIALQPEQLGGVTVQLRQTATGVQVVVAAERPETSVLIERDRHRLLKVLDASGLKVDEIAIRHSPDAAAAAIHQQQDAGVSQSTMQQAASQQGASQQGAGQQGGSQLFGGAAGGERQQAGRSGRPTGRQENDKDDAQASDDRGRRGALYV